MAASRSAGHDRLIVRVAAELDVGEWDVFALAHRHWFGREAEPAVLEPVFDAYLRRQQAPFWARHFARAVLSGEAAGRAGRERRPPRHPQLQLACAGLAFTAIMILLLSAPAPQQPRPSCAGGGPGLLLLEQLAYAAADRQPPACR